MKATDTGNQSQTADQRPITKQQVLGLFSDDGETRAFRERAHIIAHEFVTSRQICASTELSVLRRELADASIPDAPVAPTNYLEYLTRQVIPNSMHVSSPTFIGHMTSALPCFVQELGALLVAMNQNTVKLETAKSLSLIERQALGMLHRLIYNSPDRFYAEHVQDAESTLGVFASGGTVANTTALWCARNAALIACEGFAGVEAEGMAAGLNHYGYTGAAIVGSALMHYSLDKAAGLLGVGTSNLFKIPVDADNRVDAKLVRQKLSDCRSRGICVLAVIGVAGTTESGAIDPLDELADIAEEFGVHFHVDAAWGGALLFSEQYRPRLKGIERADSVTIDGHKQMYVPMGTGMAIFRNPTLARAIEKQARYIVRRGSYDLGRRSLEGSRPANALYLHAGLHILGRKGYEALIDEGVAKARYLYEQIERRPEFESIVAPQMNIFTYRYLPEWARSRAKTLDLTREEQMHINSVNQHLQRLQRNTGTSFVSRTTLETTRYGRGIPIVVLRSVIANPLTTRNDIDAVIEEQLVHAAEAEQIVERHNAAAKQTHAAQS